MTSPFNWKGKPSTFSSDRTFTERHTQIADQARKNIADGKTHATIPGLSRKADNQVLAYSRAIAKKGAGNA